MRALVLSGGGNRGALQAGALEVLIGAGIVPDLLVGASVGAVNAAFLAGRPTPEGTQELARIWRGLGGADVFAGSRAQRLMRLLRRSDHLYAPVGLRRLLEHHLPYRRIEEAPVPFVVVATDLATGAERRLDRGPVAEAVLASAAIPGVFPPVAWGGELLCDGGIAANVPVAAALAAGADEVWVLDTTQPCVARRPPRSAIDMALQAIALMGTARAAAELACPPGRSVIHHLPLPCRVDRWFADFSATPTFLADGASAARAYLEEGHPSATRVLTEGGVPTT